MQICVHGGRRVMATSSLHCFHRCCSLRWQPTPASCAVSGPSICLMHSNSHRASCFVSCANNFHAHYLVRALYHMSKLMALIVRLSPYCLTVLCRCVSCCVSVGLCEQIRNEWHNSVMAQQADQPVTTNPKGIFRFTHAGD